MRVAVIGSGIAGLSAAWLLSSRHEVVLYERDPRIGGHANTVDVPGQDGPIAVDTGFIVMNRRNYPLLTRAFEHLNVPTIATGMSFGVSADGGAMEWSGCTLGGLMAQPGNFLRPSFLRMLADIVRFNRLAASFAKGSQDDMTLGAFLQQGRFGQGLSRWYLLPMIAAIWSAPIETAVGFSARSTLRFFANHGLLEISDDTAWYSVAGGSRTYIQRMSRPLLQAARLRTSVAKICSSPAGVTVVDVKGAADQFDQVVVAAHADQALAMLDPVTDRERQILSRFPYQPNRVVLHGDRKLMPKRRAVWSAWNHMAERQPDGTEQVAVTYWMNRLQRLPEHTPLFVSLNPFREPDPATVHGTFAYDHPIFSADAVQAQRELHGIQGTRGIWFCGAWTGYGFHEDGIRSGLEIAHRLGVVAPWEAASIPVTAELPHQPELAPAFAM
jgi:predicted NAD/FAD-binding protein